MSGEANIFLIGARASGKTTLGRRLAARLRRPFVDTDRRVRLRTGKTVAELVDEGGWERFRDEEGVVLAEVAMYRGQIISCGGGIVLRQDNRECLKSGIVIYLSAPAEVLAARLSRNPEHAQRPALPGQADTGLLDEVRRVLAEREETYRACAHITLPADEPLERLADLALAEMERVGGARAVVAGPGRIS